MTIIEFFGPPCTGKTYLADFLNKTNDSIILSDKLIYTYSDKFLKLSLSEKLSLNYFKFIKNLKKKNVKSKNYSIQKKNLKKMTYNNYTKFMVKNYRNICKKLFNLYKKKNFQFIQLYLKQIDKIEDKEKRKIFKIWLEETTAKYFIAKKIKEKKIVLFDEGFAQRASFLLHLRNNYKPKLKNLISLSEKPDYFVFVDNKASELLKRSKKRAKNFNRVFEYKNTDQVRKYKLFFKDYFNNIKVQN